MFLHVTVMELMIWNHLLSYDKDGRLVKIKMEDGGITTLDYTDNHITIKEEASGNKIILELNSEGKIIKISDGGVRVTELKYDNGNISVITDALGKAVSPVSYEWNTDRIKATSEVEVKLVAYDGSYAVIGVPYETPDYTIDGEITGSGSDVTEWNVYDKCKKEECRAKEIVWLSNKMKFTLPRGVRIGAAYTDISEAYYKNPNPDKSYIYYDVKDVLTDSAKLKKYNKAEEAYIGGKIYKTTTMIEYNYKENPDAYPFTNNSKNIIRYGFNSIVDTDETLGQWYIDYATANSKVVGVYFHMKGADD